ncbi:MAG TPA: class I adenylate-forming enzyme family protein [Oligoflexia bacterium]|nr:class I adenylate-forming enzyme family protein [Oligoflexia bacterium]HMP49865.1 class I adenylate-forming enzyme family protein [Oligoflexia bacterium]
MKRHPLSKIIRKNIEVSPDSKAIYCGGVFVSYSELYSSVDLLVVALRHRGVQSGDVVVLSMDSSPAFIVFLLAAVEMGLVLAPFAADLGTSEKSQALSVVGPKYFIESGNDILGEYSMGRFDRGSSCEDLKRVAPFGGFVRFTSGTTGTSKGVLVSFDSALERVIAAEPAFMCGNQDKVLFMMMMPYHFIVSLLLFLKNGACVLIPDRVGDSLENLVSLSTIIYGTPHHFERILQISRKKNCNPKHLRMAMSTSTRLNRSVRDEFKSKFGVSLSQSLGIIEIGIPVSSLVNGISAEGEADVSDNVLGVPLPAYEIGFADEAGRVCSELSEGLISIRGPGMFDAYLEPFKMRAEVLYDSWFVTSDLGSRREDGVILLHGRASSVVNVGGYKVFPEEVEEILIEHKDVDQVQVFGVGHEIFGSSLHAKVVLREGSYPDKEELISYCRKRLGRIKSPKEILFVDNIIKTHTGKVSRVLE